MAIQECRLRDEKKKRKKRRQKGGFLNRYDFAYAGRDVVDQTFKN